MKRPAAHTNQPRQHLLGGGNNNDSDDLETGKRARVVTMQHDMVDTQQKEKPIPTVPPCQLQATANEGHCTEIALVDLFAGLRTVHVAAKTTGINFVLCASAEKCPFANMLAKKNKIAEKLFTDIKHMDKAWAKAFVADAIALGAKCIFVIGGFPCKGLSKARGKSRENLKNKDSILFFEATRILEILRQASGRRIVVHHAIENVVMDKDPESIITEHLAGRPTKIPAGPVCAATRDRLFWCDFSIEAAPGERLEQGTHRNTLHLAEDPRKLNLG